MTQRDFILNSLKEGLRLDGRDMLSHRDIDIKFGDDLGQVEVSFGNTKFYTKVYAEIIEPKADRPSEGELKFKVDLSILDSQKAKIQSIEIQKIIEKIIKSSKVIDVKSLNIISSKQCWSVQIDATLLNNDGNLIDTCYYSVIIALINFKKPFIKIGDKNQIQVMYDEKQKYQSLSINHIPLTFTFGLFDESQYIVSDQSLLEEEYQDGRMTIAMNIYNDICMINKPGGSLFDQQINRLILQACQKKVKDITSSIRIILQNQQKHKLADLFLQQN